MRLIDADATFELLRSLGSRDYRRDKGTIMDAMKMISHPEYTPTVDAVPVVHGKWDTVFYERNGTLASYSHLCPVCKYFYKDVRFKGHNYCPNCGAKMDGDENGTLD